MSTEKSKNPSRIVPIPEILSRLGEIARGTLYLRFKYDPTFPKRISIGRGSRRVGVLEADLEKWIQEQAMNAK
jgi:predicted DNA-binding transcriptional regulator AlpA